MPFFTHTTRRSPYQQILYLWILQGGNPAPDHSFPCSLQQFGCLNAGFIYMHRFTTKHQFVRESMASAELIDLVLDPAAYKQENCSTQPAPQPRSSPTRFREALQELYRFQSLSSSGISISYSTLHLFSSRNTVINTISSAPEHPRFQLIHCSICLPETKTNQPAPSPRGLQNATPSSVLFI